MNTWKKYYPLILFVSTFLSALVLISIPENYRSGAFLALILGAIIIYLYLKRSAVVSIIHSKAILVNSINHLIETLEAKVTQIKFPAYTAYLEVVLLLLIALFVTQAYLDIDPSKQINGREAEWITGHAQVAYHGLRETGVIPLWNPHYNRGGVPLVDNAVSFLLNPFSTIPSLLFGVVQGTKYSIVMAACIAAIGGWYLGRILGLGILGRILLGMLMLGKGNMHTMITAGYFQLGIQQAYFPWITAGTIMVLHTPKRLGIILLAVSMTLTFWAGNVWYILPMIVNVAVLTAFHLIQSRLQKLFDWKMLQRLTIATLLTVSLSAIYTLPVVLNSDHIGSHPDEIEAGWVFEDRWQIPELFVDPNTHNITVYYPAKGQYGPSSPHFHYSYVVPVWFVLIIFFVIPPFYSRRTSTENRHLWRIWFAGIVMIILMSMWGAGGTELFKYLYEHSALLRGWRFVGRAFAVASFWVAILIAIRVDNIVKTISETAKSVLLKYGIIIVLSIFSLSAAWHVIDQWRNAKLFSSVNQQIRQCFAEFREMNSDSLVPIRMRGYNLAWAYIDYDLRLWNIEADFFLLPDPNTLGHPRLNLLTVQPDFAYVQEQPYDLPTLIGLGYSGWQDSPIIAERLCIYRSLSEIPYAFVLNTNNLADHNSWDSLQFHATPITSYFRQYDTIAVGVQGREEETVLVLQELAYPGWQVWVNGERAKLDIVGGYIAVTIPSGTVMSEVVFKYRPPLLYLGSIATLISIGGIIVYLLGLEKWIWKHFSRLIPRVNIDWNNRKLET